MRKYLVVILLTWCAPFASVEAAIVDLISSMDCAQANAGTGNGCDGTGSASMTFDTDTNEFSWDVMWSGLFGNVTVAHFHGPALPSQNAGVQVTIDATSNPTSGSEIIAPSQASDLLAGLWYVNIHSDLFPAGEIRGQVNVVPVPAALWLFGTALAGLIGFGKQKKRFNL